MVYLMHQDQAISNINDKIHVIDRLVPIGNENHLFN